MHVFKVLEGGAFKMVDCRMAVLLKLVANAKAGRLFSSV
jgi:hypothetical protein